MFNIEIHLNGRVPYLLDRKKERTAYRMRSAMCKKYKEALLNHISDDFNLENINETLCLQFNANNDKIKEDYSFIKDQKFKVALQLYIKELHSGIGLIF